APLVRVGLLRRRALGPADMVARADLCAGLSHIAAWEPAGERISALTDRQLLAARAFPESAERELARSRRGPGASRAWQAMEGAPTGPALLRPSLRAVQGLHGVLWSAIRRLSAGRIRRRIPLWPRRDTAREAPLGGYVSAARRRASDAG